MRETWQDIFWSLLKSAISSPVTLLPSRQWTYIGNDFLWNIKDIALSDQGAELKKLLKEDSLIDIIQKDIYLVNICCEICLHKKSNDMRSVSKWKNFYALTYKILEREYAPARYWIPSRSGEVQGMDSPVQARESSFPWLQKRGRSGCDVFYHE